MTDRLTAKVAIVTGAGTRAGDGIGVGRATATLLAREGARVLLVDLEWENAETTRCALAAEGLDAAVCIADVSKPGDCERLVDTAIEHFGRIDILANCVGISCLGKVTEIDEEAWDRCLDVDLKSMAFTSKFAIPKMAAGGGGSIIHISSIDGIRAGFAPNIPYAAAKGGAIALTRNMAVHQAAREFASTASRRDSSTRRWSARELAPSSASCGVRRGRSASRARRGTWRGPRSFSPATRAAGSAAWYCPSMRGPWHRRRWACMRTCHK